jgi:coenzyme F420 hydrogenase subunit beta
MERFCVACGACLGVCPSNAILPKTRQGIATIRINPKKCSDCNLCADVCPVLDYLKESPTKKPIDKTFFQMFLGSSCNEQIRNNSASGGLVTALSSYLLCKGVVDGVLTVKMRGTKPFPFIAKNSAELIDAQGSIYFPTFNLRSTKLLKNTKKKLAIVGLPCQIIAAKKLIRKGTLGEENVKYLFGLRCYHINSPWYLDYLITRMLRMPKNKISQITSRKHTWRGGIDVKDKANTYFVPLVFDRKHGLGVFNSMVLNHFSAQPGCIICKDRDSMNADITFAEAWFTTGKSLIIARTKKGLELINEARSEGKIEIESVKQENLLHLVEGEDMAYGHQQQIITDMTEHGFEACIRKHGFLSVPITLPYLILNSPFPRRAVLQTIPPTILMNMISIYCRMLNDYFLH